MKKVLWFSRHQMTQEQKEALGDVEIVQIDRTINSAFELKEEVEAADIVAIVAPIHLQEQFLRIAGDRPVITALSERRLVPDGNGGETKVEFVFQKWERLVRIVVEKEDFVVS